MKCVFGAWGQVKRGFQVLALGEMCFEGIGGSCKGGLRFSPWVKCVFRAWGQLKRGFEMLALGEMCSEGMGAVAKGASGVGTG